MELIPKCFKNMHNLVYFALIFNLYCLHATALASSVYLLDILALKRKTKD